MKQENRRGKALSVVMSATLAATFGVPALAVADEAVSTPAAIEQSVASDGVQQGALAAASTEQKALQVQAEGQGAIKVGETSYPTLQEAVDAVSAGTASGKIVTLTGNVSGNGVVVKSGTDFTLNLGGFTYTVDGSTVGSTGTETNGFQLLQDSNITFRNGTIKSDKAPILIQNYSNLTLEGVSLEGGKRTQYTLSNNNGNTVIGAGTNVKAGQAAPKVAFDVCGFSSYKQVGVTVSPDAGAIVGAIELSSGNDADLSLSINGGDLSAASLSVASGGNKVKVEKSENVALPAPDGHQWVDGGLVAVGNNVAAIKNADGSVVGYESVSEAIEKASDGTVVFMLADVEEDVAIPEGKTVSIDLSGKKIANLAGNTITVGAGANFSVVDSVGGGVVDNATHGKAALSIEEGAEVVLNGGTFERSKEAGTASGANGNSYYTILNKGDLEINGGTTVKLLLADGSPAGFSSVIANGWYSGAPSTPGYTAQLTMNGGVVEGGKYLKNDSYGTMTINGGEVKNGAEASILNWNELTITGGTLDPSDAANGVVFNVKVGDPEQGKTVVLGGTFVTTGDQEVIFTSDDANRSENAEVSGGVFEGNPPADEYIAPGFGFEKQEDGSFGIVAAKLLVKDSVVDGVYSYDVKGGKAAALAESDLLALVEMNVEQGYTVKVDTKHLAELNKAVGAADTSKTFDFVFTAVKDGAAEGDESGVDPLTVTVKLSDSAAGSGSEGGSTAGNAGGNSSGNTNQSVKADGSKSSATFAKTNDASHIAVAAVALTGVAAAGAAAAATRKRREE